MSSATRNTVQRQLVLQAVQALHNHPTAEQIYLHVAQTHPSVSRATVYRNLGLLADGGAIKRVSHLNAADRFDFALHPHYHAICRGCGNVFDIEVEVDADLLQQANANDGFLCESCEITFTGLCPACQGQAKAG